MNETTNNTNSTPLPNFAPQTSNQSSRLSPRIILSLGGILLLGGVAVLGMVISNKSYSPRSYKSKASAATFNSCEVTFTIPSPTPTQIPSVAPSPTPTIQPSPTSPPSAAGICKAYFTVSHTGVCWYNPKTFTVTVKVDSLPKANGHYSLTTNWRGTVTYSNPTAPTITPDHYVEKYVTNLEAGKSYSFDVPWPGVKTYPGADNIDIDVGFAVYDDDTQRIIDACAKSIDYFWTPYVPCPSPPIE